MVYQTVYHGYYCSNYVGNQFIIATAKGFMQVLRVASSRQQPLAVVYWTYTASIHCTGSPFYPAGQGSQLCVFVCVCVGAVCVCQSGVCVSVRSVCVSLIT